ncbi:MAG TPA: leucyl aminopeptidase [Candidatus Dormibacteraeota bacterium]
MRSSLTQQPPGQIDADALAVAVSAGEQVGGLAVELDQSLGGLIREAIESGEHRGRLNEVLVVGTAGRAAARRVLLYGIGPRADLDGQRLRFAHHEMVRAARGYGYRRLAVLRVPPLAEGDLTAVVEGCVMGAWERRSRQTGTRPARLEELVLAGFGAGREREVLAAQEVGEAVNQAREWQNMPPNELTPEALAQEARKMADRHGLELEVLGAAELRAGGYNLLLGVAAGSSEPPRLIRLTYRGAPHSPADAGGESRAPEVRLAMVGKGITFDTGGISLKPAEKMYRMKGDMAGAAAVLAAMDVIASRRPAGIDVMAVVAATENMPGGHAQRPGDIVTSANGKTVEIVNTDAEGRLVLADAMTFALRHAATHLVDLATLTGAATVAVGHGATAALANDDGFWDLVERAGSRSGDRVWRLPAYPDYRVLLNSRTADIRNGEYGEAGMILGGMFIQQFVEERPWVHLDIAASSWNANDELTTIPRGPLGSGTRLLIYLTELMSAGRR